MAGDADRLNGAESGEMSGPTVGPPPAGAGVAVGTSVECSSHRRLGGPSATYLTLLWPPLSLFFELFLVIFCLFHMLVCSGGAVDRRFYLFTFHHLSCLVMMFSLFFIGLAGLVLGSVLRLLPDEALPHTDLPSRTPKAFQSPRQPGQPFNHGYFLS